jgi:hypothetical protein
MPVAPPTLKCWVSLPCSIQTQSIVFMNDFYRNLIRTYISICSSNCWSWSNQFIVRRIITKTLPNDPRIYLLNPKHFVSQTAQKVIPCTHGAWTPASPCTIEVQVEPIPPILLGKCTVSKPCCFSIQAFQHQQIDPVRVASCIRPHRMHSQINNDECKNCMRQCLHRSSTVVRNHDLTDGQCYSSRCTASSVTDTRVLY